jgi:hypothetical protein
MKIIINVQNNMCVLINESCFNFTSMSHFIIGMKTIKTKQFSKGHKPTTMKANLVSSLNHGTRNSKTRT